MKILALEHETPGVTAEQFQPLLRAEAARLYQLVQSGLVRETYFRADRHDVVLVLECADLEQARAALDTLPLVAAHLITFELVPLVPYNGWERLFGKWDTD